MIIHDALNTDEGMLELMIKRLRSGEISRAELAHLADMLEPKSSKTNFRLELVRRPGNRQQRDDNWFYRLHAFGDIYDAVDGNEKKALDRAELPEEDGGMGVERPTARKYLGLWKAYLLAQRDAE